MAAKGGLALLGGRHCRRVNITKKTDDREEKKIGGLAKWRNMKSQCTTLIARPADLTILFQSDPTLSSSRERMGDTYKCACWVSHNRHHAVMYDAWPSSQKSPPGHPLLTIPPRFASLPPVASTGVAEMAAEKGNKLSEGVLLCMEVKGREAKKCIRTMRKTWAGHGRRQGSGNRNKTIGACIATP
jgi:hypothetical protein